MGPNGIPVAGMHFISSSQIDDRIFHFHFLDRWTTVKCPSVINSKGFHTVFLCAVCALWILTLYRLDTSAVLSTFEWKLPSVSVFPSTILYAYFPFENIRSVWSDEEIVVFIKSNHETDISVLRATCCFLSLCPTHIHQTVVDGNGY